MYDQLHSTVFEGKIGDVPHRVMPNDDPKMLQGGLNIASRGQAQLLRAWATLQLTLKYLVHRGR